MVRSAEHVPAFTQHRALLQGGRSMARANAAGQPHITRIAQPRSYRLSSDNFASATCSPHSCNNIPPEADPAALQSSSPIRSLNANACSATDAVRTKPPTYLKCKISCNLTLPVSNARSSTDYIRGKYLHNKTGSQSSMPHAYIAINHQKTVHHARNMRTMNVHQRWGNPRRSIRKWKGPTTRHTSLQR